jgi:hypothetical protein
VNTADANKFKSPVKVQPKDWEPAEGQEGDVEKKDPEAPIDPRYLKRDPLGYNELASKNQEIFTKVPPKYPFQNTNRSK